MPRKVPFSGKAKKNQLKTKRTRKQDFKGVPLLQSDSSNAEGGSGIQRLNYQSNKRASSNTNRYALHFFKESNAEIQVRKEQARRTLEHKAEEDLEINGDDYYTKSLDFPKRPPWSFDLKKEVLEAKENRYFTDYLKNVEAQFEDGNVSYFELNLETWRQLWRVLEMSDVILFIVDIRFSALMFPPSLYEYVTKDLEKDFILVLNKIDLAPAALVVAWKHYFQEKYPELHIVMFTTLPGYNLIGKTADKAGLQVRRTKGRPKMAAEGTQQLFEACKTLAGTHVDLSDWQNKIKEEMQDHTADDKVEIGENINLKSVDTQFFQYEKYKNGVLTIGCLGQPNVGKSSLLNAIMGKKVVSVSRTPGHTKHFQTIFLTPHVKLCDCPGLVFPSKVPKPLQVLMGTFPIAQLREPFTTVKFIAERLNLISLLRIQHPENDTTWSAMDICDGWAKRCGFITSKSGRLDSYRAANSLLRMALAGKITLCLRPPDYKIKTDFWNQHPDIEKVKWIQAKTDDEELNSSPPISISDDDEPESDSKDESDGDEGDESSEEDEPEVKVGGNKFAALQDSE